jgi:hypothetical protein
VSVSEPARSNRPCQCVGCQQARALQDAHAKAVALEEANRKLYAMLADHRDEIHRQAEARRTVEAHRDRLVESHRELRVENDRLREQLRAADRAPVEVPR